VFNHSDLPEAAIQTTHLVLQPALKQCLAAFRSDFWQSEGNSGYLDTRRRNLTHNLVMQIASACAHLHARGVMHRDIKPDNIGVAGLREPFVFYLLDLGHATEAQSRDDHCKGTIRYLAPEVLDLKYRRTTLVPNYGLKVDVWSLGLTGGELICKETIRSESDGFK